MTDIASLGLEINTSQVTQGVTELDKLDAAGKRVGATMDSLKDTSEKAGASVRKGSDAYVEARKQTDQMVNSMKYWNEEQKKIDMANGVVSNSTLKAAEAADKFMFKLQQMAEKASMSNIELLKMQAAQHGVTEGATPLIEKIEQAASAQGKHAFSMQSSLAKIEALRVAHDAMIGSYTRMGSSLFVLGNASGATAALFSGMGFAILGVVGALTAFTVAAIKGAAESAEFSKQMKLTGDYAGITEGQFNSMAKSMANASDTGIGSAREMLQAFIATGKFTGDTLDATSKAAIDFAKSSGKSSEDVVKDFEKMSDGVASWAESHNKSYHFLTAAQYEHIAALEREGKTSEAMQVTMEAFDNRIKKNAENLGLLQSAYHLAGIAVSGFWDSMKSVGREKTVDDDIASAQSQLASLKLRAAAAAGTQEGSRISVSIAGAEGLLAQLKVQKDLQESDKRDIALQQQWHDLAIQAVKDHQTITDSLKTRAQQGEDAVKKYLDGQKLIIQEGTLAADDEKTRLAIMAGIRAQYAEKEVAAKLTDYQKLSKLINERISNQEMELAGDAKLSEGQKLAAKFSTDLRDGVINLSTAEKIRTASLLEMLMADERANQAKADAAKESQNLIDIGYKEIKSLQDKLQKQLDYNDTIGLSKSQIDDLTSSKLTLSAAQDDELSSNLMAAAQYAGPLHDAYVQYATDLKNAAEMKRQLAAAKDVASDKDAANQALIDQKKLSEMTIQYWRDAGREISTALTDAFGKSGKAAGDMFNAHAIYMAKEAKIKRDVIEGEKAADGDLAKLKLVHDRAALESQIAQTKQYGDMATAAQGFFQEGSRGYEAMGAAAKVMHAAEEALMIVKGINAILTQGEGDPYSAFARIAAMTAIVVGLGVAVAGGNSGGGGVSAAERQASQGTGTVLGDLSAKSDSLAKSMEDLKKNSDESLPISQGMLTSLQNIESAMTGLAQIIFRTTGIASGNGLNIFEGTTNASTMGIGGAMKSLDRFSASISSDFINKLAAPITGAVNGLVQSFFGKTSQNISDSGLSIGGTLGNVSQGQGISQYANIHSETSSFFGLSKSSSDSTVRAAVDATISDQIGKVFKGISDTLLLASSTFVSDTTGIQKELQDYVVNIPTVSLRGLTGQALQDALNAVFSSFSDTLAHTVIPGMDDFQKVGEGYFQTLIRIVNGVESADAALTKFGIAAIDFKDIINKQGDVAVEIMRQSIDKVEIAAQHNVHTDAYTTTQNVTTKQNIMASGIFSTGFGDVAVSFIAGVKEITTAVETLHPATDTLVTDLTGVGKIIDAFSGSASDLAALYQSLLDLRKLMGDTQLNGRDLSASMIQGAGGLDQLKSGLSDYLDKYFTPSEKATAQIKDMAASFGLLGLQLPATKDAFRSLVGSIDTSTDAGAKLAGSIIALAGPYSDMIDAIASGNTDIQATIDGFKTFSDTLLKFRDSLLLGNLSTLTPEQKYAEALAQYQITLASAKSGNTTAQNDLTGVMQAFLQASQVVNASGAQYQADFAKVLKDTSDAAAYSKGQIDIAQSSLDTLNSINGNLIDLVSVTAGLKSTSTFSGTSDMMTINGSHAGGLGYVPFDGYIAELHRGEAVLTANQAINYRNMGSLDMGPLVSEIKGLRASNDALLKEVAALRADQNQQTGALIASNYDANDRAANKVAAGSKEAAKDMAWANSSKAVVI